jgi:hypothetical protein
VTARRSLSVAALTVAGLTTMGVTRWRAALPAQRYESTRIGSATPSIADSLEAMLAHAEDVTVTNDPFRLANAPASVRYNPNSDNVAGGSVATVAPPLRPTMTLKAIVGGPPWQAIVDGIPGQPQGTLVRAGNAFDRLITRAVTRDSVVIQGPDTTWVLSFRRRE